MVLDLRNTDRNLDCNVFTEFIAISDLGSDSLVEDEQDLFVSHLVYLRTDSQVSEGVQRLSAALQSGPRIPHRKESIPHGAAESPPRQRKPSTPLASIVRTRVWWSTEFQHPFGWDQADAKPPRRVSESRWTTTPGVDCRSEHQPHSRRSMDAWSRPSRCLNAACLGTLFTTIRLPRGRCCHGCAGSAQGDR